MKIPKVIAAATINKPPTMPLYKRNQLKVSAVRSTDHTHPTIAPIGTLDLGATEQYVLITVLLLPCEISFSASVLLGV
jgi:hypothetical protein